MRALPTLLLILATASCSTPPRIVFYEHASDELKAQFKKVGFPIPPGHKVVVSQGAFGDYSHKEKGNEYSWDLDVPYGTPVVSVEDGTVYEVYAPEGGAGCDAKFSDFAHNVKIKHADGTVAQYVHVNSKVKVGEHVDKGQVIAETAENGWICRPQLHFGVYKSVDHLYNSPKRQTVPLLFEGIKGGVLLSGYEYEIK